MQYEINYFTSLGEVSFLCKAWEVASVLRNMVHLALQGHQFSNVTLRKL